MGTITNQNGVWATWTDAEDSFIREFAHLGAARIAAALGRTVSGVHSRASDLRARLGGFAENRAAREALLWEEAVERFYSGVEFDTNGGCWLWTGALDHPGGYGKTRVAGRDITAHRLSWTIHFGQIPKGAFVCHKCDVRVCCNPSHLFVGTPQDNTEDMLRKGRCADRRGDKNPRSRLSEQDALVILERLEAGETHSSIAKDYGVSASTISDIRRGHTWKYLQRPWAAPRAESTRRRTMTPARRRQVLAASDGKCAGCEADLSNAKWVADHILPLELSGADEISNLQALCLDCNRGKTHWDAKRIAKMRRQAKMHEPKPSRLKSAGKLQSPGFRKDITKKFNGAVVPRKEPA